MMDFYTFINAINSNIVIGPVMDSCECIFVLALAPKLVTLMTLLEIEREKVRESTRGKVGRAGRGVSLGDRMSRKIC